MGAFIKVCFDSQNCKQPDQSLRILLNRPFFSTEEVFQYLENEARIPPLSVEKMLWVGDLADTRDETSQMRAMALPEYISYRLSQKPSYEIPLNNLFENAADVAAQTRFHESVVRDKIAKSILNVQNDLVEYVAKGGLRGAAILKSARGVSDAKVWTCPLTHIEAQKDTSRYIAHYLQ
jgi:hypothetical protein